MDSSSNGGEDMSRIWNVLADMSDQLTHNRTVSVSLHSLAGGVKAQAIHSQTGFVLRRFNLDKPKDVYDAELERMNTAMSAENQTLQNDNRQVNALIREYEQTLENVMTSFRTRAYEVQQHELALIREYENAIIQRETEALDAALTINNARSEHLARVGRLLRAVMRKLGGEDIKASEPFLLDDPPNPRHATPPSSESAKEPSDESQLADANVVEEAKPDSDAKDNYIALERELDDEEDPDNLRKRLAAAEWALDRESELARLERENEELRNLLNGVLQGDPPPAPLMSVMQRSHPHTGDQSESGRASPASSSSNLSLFRPTRQLGGPPGTVGPFGTLKQRVLS